MAKRIIQTDFLRVCAPPFGAAILMGLVVPILFP